MEISAWALVDDLIVSTSRPIRLRVKPPEVVARSAELADAAAWVRRLSERDDLRVLANALYAPEYHGFISPDSPQGKLLALGQKAVPALLDEALKEDITPERRA
jgi:hypothetical protein